MHRSVATVSLSGSLDEKLSAIARAGFDGVELFENDLITSPLSPAEVRQRAGDLGLSIDLYQPFRDAEALPAEAFAPVVRRAERKFDLMEALDLSAPPASVEPTGLAFVEIAVDHTSARKVERVLTALGFGRGGYHRSKPVHLWIQGRARVLLNHGDVRVADTLHGDALVSALALEVDNPEQAAARAQQLRSPRIAREYGPSEADLSAASAPDGTAIFFCRTAATDTQSWVTDFVPAEPPVPPAPSGITHIDHMGLSQPFDHFDEALLFYRSVLGLRLQSVQELPAPYGLVRSRALSSADGAVRIALSVAVLGRGGSVRGAPEPQQIAFACDDIFAAVRAMRAAGGDLLPIPDNYYDDLAARTDLDDALIRRLRQNSVLHDHSDSGAFFHFYTPLIGRRLFLEVVQRVGAYDGYGAPNTPVRMAALRVAPHA